jgi:zinc/manganese transport system substrate-binding protein
MNQEVFSLRTRSMRRVAVLAVAALLVSACGGDDESADASTPQVVVTYSVLGSVVESLVGDRADVEVIVPNGQDPHDFSPSARDVEAINNAAFVVANGLDLEEGLAPSLEEASKNGRPVFFAADHVTLRTLDEEGEHSEEEAHADEEADEHGHSGEDPHIWVDPLTLSEMLPELGAELGDAIGADLSADVARVQAELADADAAVSAIMADLAEGQCKLVTGHDSLGYFADRYGCQIVGAVIPSLTSTAEASAQELAELREVAQAEGVAAIFTEPGTSEDVAAQIAGEIGVPLIELPTIELPEDGMYRTFITQLSTVITDGLLGR